MSHRTKGENLPKPLKHLPKPFCRYKTMSYDRGSLCCPRFGRTPLAWSLNLTLQKLYQQYIHYTYKKIRKKNPNITNFVLCILNPTERGFPNFQYWEMSGKSPFSTSYRFFVNFFFFRLANLALVHLIQSYNSPSNDAAEVSTQSLDNWKQLERIKKIASRQKRRLRWWWRWWCNQLWEHNNNPVSMLTGLLLNSVRVRKLL